MHLLARAFYLKPSCSFGFWWWWWWWF